MLAEFVTGLPTWGHAESLVYQAKRSFINFLAVTISGACQAPAVALLSWIRASGGTAQATIVLQDWRTSTYNAALVNGYACHLQDYDDTHLPSVLHPSAVVWPAVLAATEHVGATGKDALLAYIVGAETACRVAMSVHPWHYDSGWHITGTVGGFGAAAGSARVLGLSVDQTTHALGIAATQACGIREVFGSMTKALHAGRAAANGLQAAELALGGFTSTEQALEGRRGFWAVLSPDGHDESVLLDGLGDRWELRANGLKPYANGVVAHPLQDGAIRLRDEHGLRPEDIGSIEVTVNPLVLELMDRQEPRTGLEAKFSYQHCIAAALVDGAAHDEQFTDAKVRDARIVRLRGLISARADTAMPEDAAEVVIIRRDGGTVRSEIDHATGSTENPMSDAQLERKFRSLVVPMIGSERAEQLLATAWRLEDATDLGECLNPR